MGFDIRKEANTYIYRQEGWIKAKIPEMEMAAIPKKGDYRMG
jgi:hypothetical protein